MPTNGDLKVWWVPQMPMEAFYVDVPDLDSASLVLDVLGRYDAFQYENRIKPDYCNAGGLIEFDGADWPDWSCHETGDDFDMVREDPERLAQAIAYRAAQVPA